MSTPDRKDEHLRLAADPASQWATTAGFADVRLAPNALPELDLADVDTRTDWLGGGLSAPLFITGMTGGTPATAEVNRGIAAACQTVGIGMGLGSQRAMIEDPTRADTFQVRDMAPDICLAANIGAAQLLEYEPDRVFRAAETVGATVLAVHLNAAQEAVQREGTPRFRGVSAALRRLCEAAPLPVYVKEVGGGISRDTAATLGDLGVAGIDVAGAGGTNWVQIEVQRGAAASGVAAYGLPTVCSLLEARAGFTGPLMASGGVRSSRDVAVALALGAQACGLAWPVLRAFREGGAPAIVSYVQGFIDDIRRQLFVHGAATPHDMRTVPAVLLGDTYAWAHQRGLLPC